LYGEFDLSSQDWRDGILAAVMRASSRDTSGDHHWIVFDGPVDSEWIESMNTVLDDNKKLCLNSSEIIHVTQNILTMFEVGDLENASPATVSRCGMVHMDPAALGPAPLIRSWVDELPPIFDDHRLRIKQLCDDFFFPMLEFLRSPECTEILSTTDDGLCTSFLKMLKCQLDYFLPSEEQADMKSGEAAAALTRQTTMKGELHRNLDQLFLYVVAWSVGASCDAASRQRFGSKLRQLAVKACIDVTGLDVQEIHNYMYSRESGQWVAWMQTVPNFEVTEQHGRAAQFEEIVVPTIDTVSTSAILQCLIMGHSHVLCPGPTGTGKSTVIRRLLYGENIPRYVVKSLLIRKNSSCVTKCRAH
jgi:dynein heavy chain